MLQLATNTTSFKRSGLVILSYLLCFSLNSCEEDSIEIRFVNTASLNLINQLDDNFTITSWKIQGYEFQNLTIPPGYSQQFDLMDGMRNGFKNVDITIVLSSDTGSLSKNYRLNFIRGGITAFTLSGCGACDEP